MDRHNRRTHLHHKRGGVKRAPQNTVIVYKTLSATFDGPIAGYSTVGVVGKPESPTPTPRVTSQPVRQDDTPTPRPRPTQPPPPKNDEEDEEEIEEDEKPQEKPETTRVRPQTTSIVTEDDEEEEETSSIRTTLATMTSSYALELEATATLDTTSTISSTATALPNGENETSGGSNVAGVAGGIVAGLLALLCIAAFFYRKRKQKIMNEAYRKAASEKPDPNMLESSGMGGAAAAAHANPFNEKAPRVSLRPVTQFNPLLNTPMAAAAAAAPVVKTGPSTAKEVQRKPLPAPLALSKPPMNDMTVTETTIENPAAVAAPVMPAAQDSPTLSAFSDAPGTPATPVDAAALVANGQPAPVYRVQMDYVPMQPDELEIRAGALVRMLHEYDDGWALCVRMDRSQQGVCPRTCLSARPVKPRPNPAPGSPGAQRRGPPPRGAGPGGPGPQPGYTNNGPQPGSPGPQRFQGQGGQQQQGSRPQTPVQAHKLPYSSRPGTPTQQQRPVQVPQITVSPSQEDLAAEQQRQQPQGGAPVGYAM